LLETDRLFDELPENAKSGYKLMCIEPSWKNDVSKKCDIYYYVYKSIRSVAS